MTRPQETFTDMLARLFPMPGIQLGINSPHSKCITFQVTEDCNLRCSYCYCFDFLARISHQPFVKDIPQRGKVIVALCAVHSVIDSDEADTFLWENHFRVHSHLQVVSP